MLRRLMLKTQYRKDAHDLARDFYARCLPESEQFDRAVGFFSTDVFAAAPEAFRAFFKAGGRMRVVMSPLLSARDVRRLTRGYTDRPTLARTERLDLLSGSPAAVRRGLDEVIPWLVAKDLLAVHVARPVGGNERDLYHEKVGLFTDADGEAVAFGGSANETYSALQRNFEVVDVYRSWNAAERGRVSRKRDDFDRLWSNNTPGLEVVPFARAAREGWLVVRESGPLDSPSAASETGELRTADVQGLDEVLHLPGHVRLYPHQRRAVRAWLEARGRGVLEMATGSGKTITALAGATKLYELIGNPLVIVVLCPYLHLVQQWTEEAREFGLDPVPCARGRTRWEAELNARLYGLQAGSRSLVSAVVSNDTFRTDAFQGALSSLRAPLLLIGDEMHNLGAPGLRRSLPSDATYRLGLSATPDRLYDPLGTAALSAYFGPTLGEPYTLAHALTDGVLTPYVYVPHIVGLTEDETEAYQVLTEKIGRAFAAADADGDTGGLERLLIRRARLTATAAGKLPLLRTLMEPRRDDRHMLVYCGDGRVDEEGSEGEIRQVEATTRVLGLGLGMRVARYTAETPPERRRALLDQFALGDVQALVAIRCLDEGVDIPATRTAFLLASATDPRQYVQRRGRVLRRAPGKAQAEVHDFLVAPPLAHQDPSSPYYAATRRLFGRELARASEFADLAENGPEALGRLLPLRDRLNLLTANLEDEDVPGHS
jgi:superfamily II DNA or RNA helicase